MDDGDEDLIGLRVQWSEDRGLQDVTPATRDTDLRNMHAQLVHWDDGSSFDERIMNGFAAFHI